MQKSLLNRSDAPFASEYKKTETSPPLMYCYGCDEKCSIECARLRKYKDCNGLEFYIWPDNNSFLVEGMLPYFLDINDKLISQPVVIIDFNYKNIDYFLSKNWLDNFKRMRLILLSDKKTAAIAHYWFYNDTVDTIISSVIFHDDTSDEIVAKIRNTFLAKITKPSESRPKLSTNEFSLFSSLYNGELPKKIALKNETSVKNVYAMKKRIEQKLGVTITRLSN
ncbi:RmbA family protein [Trabulsiella guamensis ATCC 49490]|uniref:RmbA family protein n=1 Tax=Trabulsiella guamensis ATCC 49490 TaxID=1005994 RepID=A0A085AA56_9ENTR|nr:hypothetical protein [Trabulsiella guamensis]KFC07101.1 RmbA family protein [Trabulsiella guamensis ATCC 49490]